jgi:hypothetical protein
VIENVITTHLWTRILDIDNPLRLWSKISLGRTGGSPIPPRRGPRPRRAPGPPLENVWAFFMSLDRSGGFPMLRTIPAAVLFRASAQPFASLRIAPL